MCVRTTNNHLIKWTNYDNADECSPGPQSVRECYFVVHRCGFVFVLRLFNCVLTLHHLEVSPMGRRELDTTRIAVATTLVQDVRFYRDLNSDRRIQSPEC